MPHDPATAGFDDWTDCSRRAFLGLAAAAGLLGPALVGGSAGAPAFGDPEEPAPDPPPARPSLLALGLTALAREQRTWVAGHAGASLIAAHYFAQDNKLDERTARAHRAHVDAFIAKNPDDYPAPDPGPGKADPAKIAETLDKHVHELRSGGHDAIYAALALRALSDLPELATPSVVDGVCRLLGQHVGAYQPVRMPTHLREHPAPPCESPEELAVATFRGVLRPWDHVRLVGASGVLHWVTHAEALVTLEELGYKDVARHGYTAQQLNVHLRPLHDEGGRPPERPALDWLAAPYWESAAPRRLFRDSWLGGHAFKLPHSVLRLAQRVTDADLRRAGLQRSALLLVPFEN
jgi:hypothetical protein